MEKISLQYCSDLHLEFVSNRAFYKSNPIHAKGDILLLAGDIIPISLIADFDWFFDEIQSKFKAVYWIAGNHEFYGADISNRSGELFEVIRENIFLVNNYKLELDNCVILLTTLWSDISPRYQFHIQRGMNDYYQIKFGNRSFTTDDSNGLFKENMAFLEDELIDLPADKKCIVVTHHVPTYKNYPKEYKNSLLNEAFATELAPFIQKHSINYWIYGHSHSNIPDFKIGKTILTNNQLGYVGQNEHLNYRREALIII